MSLQVDIKKKLKGFSLEAEFKTAGEYLGILGASGSGKSMILKCIAGVETPDEGKIELNGKILFDSDKKINLKPQERNIGYSFQNYALFPHMTIEENIGLGLNCSKQEKEQRISEMISTFRLEGMEKKYPNHLSGGQQQRAALARCIIYKPDLLLLDEPFSALDSHLKEQLQTEVLDLLNLYKGEVLLVTHSRDEAYRFCKNLVIVDKGQVVMFGGTKEIFKQPKLLPAARLTGCKNISKCEVINSHSIRALDFGIVLETTEEVSETIKYVGIRAHEFKMLKDKKMDQSNSFSFKVDKIVEDVFEYNIILENNILYKVKKEEWDSLEHGDTINLFIPKEAILLLE